MRIADGDPVKLARMLERRSWFDNKDQLAVTATSMAKYLQQSEKAAILPKGAAREYISCTSGPWSKQIHRIRL